MPAQTFPLPPTGTTPIPATCEDAELQQTTVGCSFLAVDLDQADDGLDDETLPYAIVVANPQTIGSATVTVALREAGLWSTTSEALTLGPGELAAVHLLDRHPEGSRVMVGGAFRIESDVPIVAYQFNPLTQGSYTTDASLLLPEAALGDDYRVYELTEADNAGYPYGSSSVTIAAMRDGTSVEVIAPVMTDAGPGVPLGEAGQAQHIMLDAGDVLNLQASSPGGLSGTRVRSDEEHPIAVFSGTECIFIHGVACDHLEEQLLPTSMWGQHFVAAPPPSRAQLTGAHDSEPTKWILFASEDDTHVELSSSVALDGLDETRLDLMAGEQAVLTVSPPLGHPGAFLISASRPVSVTGYMTGAQAVQAAGGDPSDVGDPSAFGLLPVDQLLSSYVVLTQSAWLHGYLVLTRAAGAEIIVDGTPVPTASFVDVGASYEVAQVRVSAGVHRLESERSFAVMVVGWDDDDSYAYPGGGATVEINPAG